MDKKTTGEQTTTAQQAIAEKAACLAYEKGREAANLASVKAVNGADGLATTMSIKVTIKRGKGKYSLTCKTSVKQTETDNLDDADCEVDPDQMGLKL